MTTVKHIRRLAIITTHPIQYYAPLFKLLAERKKICIKVFYTWGEKANGQVFDPGFGKSRKWDVPLLEGYDYEFVRNISKNPGSHTFFGINNPGLKKKLLNWKPDAVLIYGWKFKSHLSIMRYYKGRIPVLFRGDSTLLDEKKGFGIKKYLRRFALKWVYRYIDFALYVGTNNKAYFTANGVSEKQLILAPHAVDNDRFSCENHCYESEVINWKKELDIPPDKLCVLFAGKLELKKNPLFLVEGAKKFPTNHFIIVGDGQLESVIRENANQLQNLSLLPFQNQTRMPVVYRLGDIFALPSQGPEETWGLAINEAMASGRMIIASNKCGGAIDLIKEGQNGIIIEAEIEAFFKALAEVQKFPSEVGVFKNNSKVLIKEFSFEKTALAIENLVIHTIAKKSFL